MTTPRYVQAWAKVHNDEAMICDRSSFCEGWFLKQEEPQHGHHEHSQSSIPSLDPHDDYFDSDAWLVGMVRKMAEQKQVLIDIRTFNPTAEVEWGNDAAVGPTLEDAICNAVLGDEK